MRVRVHVRLRQSVLDTEGRAVAQGLRAEGFSSVKGARVGKLIELDLETEDAGQARDEAKRMCEALLANPVIEDFDVEVVGTGR